MLPGCSPENESLARFMMGQLAPRLHNQILYCHPFAKLVLARVENRPRNFDTVRDVHVLDAVKNDIVSGLKRNGFHQGAVQGISEKTARSLRIEPDHMNPAQKGIFAKPPCTLHQLHYGGDSGSLVG